ncbi:MAG: hypothetical protein IPG53_21540 [Ignavibacteriales bacterium]|nr:hypothetical protein [Ignavibacteriales bacterium]
MLLNPVFLIIFIGRRKDLPFSWILVLFGLFILACGATHVVHIIELWWSVDWWQASVIRMAAIISVGTAIVVWLCFPNCSQSSPQQLRDINVGAEERQTDSPSLSYKRLTMRWELRVEERTENLLSRTVNFQRRNCGAETG